MGSTAALAILGIVALGCAAAAVLLLLRKRLTPEETERLRRLNVNAQGRMVAGVVSDVREQEILYDYSWRGMQYHSSQDISPLRHLVLGDAHSLIGPATIKFNVRNPYNSIVLCETWCGFPIGKVSLRQGTTSALPPVAE